MINEAVIASEIADLDAKDSPNYAATAKSIMSTGVHFKDAYRSAWLDCGGPLADPGKPQPQGLPPTQMIQNGVGDCWVSCFNFRSCIFLATVV